MLCLLLCLPVALGYETLDVAVDSNGQVDVYAPHTVVETHLVRDEVFGFMLNSVVQVQTPWFMIARGVCAPYTVIRYHGTPAVVSSPCHGEEWAYIVTPSNARQLPLQGFEAVRYDFAKGMLYTLSRGVITRHALCDEHYNLENITIGPSVTDFYASDGNLFYIRLNNEFRRTATGLTTRIGSSPSGRHRKFYIPSEISSGGERRASAALIMALILVLMRSG